MPTAEELLMQAAENGAVASDTKNYLTVDLRSRQITIPSTIKNIGVESDDEVHRLYFKMPRYFDEVDLSEFRTRINYTNAAGDDDCYTPTDVSFDDDYITFSWLVGRFACTVKGDVEFSICMVNYKKDGVVIDREFNTTPTTLPVLKGKETVDAIVEEERDAMAAIAKQAAEEAAKAGNEAAEKAAEEAADIKEMLGDLGAAFDELHSYAQSLVGGDAE
jgi:hypothetical protein